MSRIAYKGFDINKNNQLQCRNMIYELDKEYVINGKLKLCKNGMHFCWNVKDVHWYYDFNDSTVCEVEILGDVVTEDDKSCTNKLKILRIMGKDELMKITNEGDNDGYFNKGNGNIGNSNTGSGNIGNSNTGNNNNGYFNEGNGNKGYRNKGDNNIGDSNTGNKNIGNRNVGNNNIGSYNKGDNITGFFNTVSNIGSLDNIALFDKSSNISMEEFKQMEVYDVILRGITSLFMWDFIYTLPNFDKDIFEEIIKIEI